MGIIQARKIPPMQKAAAFCPQRLLLSTKIPHFLHLFHIHVLECFQPLLCLRLRIAVADEAHRDKACLLYTSDAADD